MSHYFENDKNLKSEFRNIVYKYDSFSFVFLSDNGVFSKDRIDFGSRLLLETYLKEVDFSEKVLDLGCGYGFIGVVVSFINGSIVHMSDVNKRALHLTKKNVMKYNLCEKVNIVESDSFENINDTYDTILTNPPIRTGKNKILEMLNSSLKHLNTNGKLYFVIRKDQGALSIKKTFEDDNNINVEIINKDKGFCILKAIKK